MASLAALRKQAKDLGVPKAMILRATSPDELQQIVSDFTEHENGDEPTPRKKVVAKKKSGNSNAKAPARKKSGGNRAPARSKKSGTAKRRGTAKDAPRSNGYVPKGGRNTLDAVDFSTTDGWNPREGSAPARIIAALKKARGNRDKAFEALKPHMKDFVNPKKANGQKRTARENEEMLRYRISRTLFDFAIRTGQHESATNRVQYGTGGTGQGIYKVKRRQEAKKAAPKAAGRKKAAQSRAKATPKAKGRPKTKAKARAKAGSRR